MERRKLKPHTTFILKTTRLGSNRLNQLKLKTIAGLKKLVKTSSKINGASKQPAKTTLKISGVQKSFFFRNMKLGPPGGPGGTERRGDALPEPCSRATLRQRRRARPRLGAFRPEVRRGATPADSRPIPIHAPLRRAPISLASLRVIRPTQVERISAIIVPPGERRDVSGSGAFALSRTHADVNASSSGARTRATRKQRQRWAAAAGATVTGLAMIAASYGLLRSGQSEAPRPTHTGVTAALAAIPAPVPPAVWEPPPVPAAADGSEVRPPVPTVVRHPLPAGRPKSRELAPWPTPCR